MLLHAAAFVHFRWSSPLSDQAGRHSELKIEVSARDKLIVADYVMSGPGLGATVLLPEQASLGSKRRLAQHEAHVWFYALPTVFAVPSVSEHAAWLIDGLSSYHQWTSCIANIETKAGIFATRH